VIRRANETNSGTAVKLKASVVNLIVLGIFILFSTVGCAERGQRQIADPAKISQIQKGVSIKASIKALFGDPDGMNFLEHGDETWDYFYTPPVTGKTAQMLGLQSRYLTVTFDTNGIVKAYGIHGS
jgi:outer membrane protein assembly factor BamE (lipoprotein component of BamABCDE complex)